MKSFSISTLPLRRKGWIEVKCYNKTKKIDYFLLVLSQKEKKREILIKANLDFLLRTANWGKKI